MKIRTAIAAAAAGQYVSTAVQFISAIVIARLLRPDEIGVFSLGMSVVAISHALRDFGVSNYIIQKEEVEERTLTAAFFFSLLSGSLLAVVLAALSGPTADFYGDQRVRTVLLLLAVNMALTPLGTVTMARLRRNMWFGSLAAIVAAASVLTAAVSISLAWFGWGYRALPLGALAGTATTVIGSAIAAVVGKESVRFARPGWSDFRALFSFSSYASGVSLVRELALNARDPIIGKTMDMAAVGLYSRADGFLSLFNQVVIAPVLSTLLPHFSREKRSGGDSLPAMLKAMQYTACVAGLYYVHLAYSSDALIRLLFGDQWVPAGDATSILCLSGFVGSLCVGFGPLFIAHQKIRTVLAVEALAKSFLVAATMVAATHSIEAVAAVSALHYLLLTALWLIALRRNFPITLRDILRSLTPSLVPLAAAALAGAIWFVLAGKPASVFSAPFVGANLTILVTFTAVMLYLRHSLLSELSSLCSGAKFQAILEAIRALGARTRR